MRKDLVIASSRDTEREKPRGLLHKLRPNFRITSHSRRRVSNISYTKEKSPVRLSRTPIPENSLQISKVHKIIESSSCNSESNYEFKSVIGHGCYSVVRKAVLKSTDESFAVKSYEKVKLLNRNKKTCVLNEINLLKSIDHPNIVKLFEVIETNDHIHLVMEWVQGCSLKKYIRNKPNRRLEDEKLKKVFTQIVNSVKYLHFKQISHRDLKLENILITYKGLIKIIDFGFATNDKENKVCCGTPIYMAPEIFNKNVLNTNATDVWALGVILYHLANGSFPFNGNSKQELFEKVTKGFYSQTSNISSDLKLLISKMLTVNPRKRPKIHEVYLN